MSEFTNALGIGSPNKIEIILNPVDLLQELYMADAASFKIHMYSLFYLDYVKVKHYLISISIIYFWTPKSYSEEPTWAVFCIFFGLSIDGEEDS